MTYAILSDNTITAHGSASLLWPNTSFPSSGPNASFLIDAGAVLIRSDAPYDPETEILQATEPYVLDGEAFGTIAAPKPIVPPQPRWVDFGSALLDDPAVNQMLGVALSTAPSVAMSISVGLGKAADGDSRVFQVSWSGAIGLGLISPELIAHVQAMAATFDLPAEFIAGLAGTP